MAQSKNPCAVEKYKKFLFSDIDMARIVKLIETTDLRGKGIEGDPYRRVTQYFTKKGELLFEIDSCDNINQE